MRRPHYECDCGQVYHSAAAINMCADQNHYQRVTPPLLPVQTPEGDIGHLQKVIAAWADRHFPTRTAHDAAVKLMLEEIPEWLRDMDDPLEYADMVILILDIAHLKGIDIRKAVLDKMKINDARTWVVDPETKLMRHVALSDDPNHNIDEVG